VASPSVRRLLAAGSWLRLRLVSLAEEVLPAPSGAWDVQAIMANGTIRVRAHALRPPAFPQRRADGTIVGRRFRSPRKSPARQCRSERFFDDAPSFDGVVDSVAAGRADIAASASCRRPTIVGPRSAFPTPISRCAMRSSTNRAVVARAGQGRPRGGLSGVSQHHWRDRAAPMSIRRRNFPLRDRRDGELGRAR